jgi:type II secretory pathway predicted ATPase ExeA
MIEEARDLSIQTKKYLKRFWEMEDGFKRPLSIVLIGQIELKSKLDESKNWEARELIRRMEILELEPLGHTSDIALYLEIKFKRLGKNRANIISDSGCAALAARLRRQTRNGVVYSWRIPCSSTTGAAGR